MLKEELIVAIGPIVRDPQDIARSAVEAERAMRLVRDSRTWRDRRVLRSEDVQTDMLLQDVKRQMIADDQHFLGPVAELIQSDRDNGTEFVRTLDVFLSSFGDIARAAAILNIHPNTCRYRLRRISETVALDLDDADARFDAMLQLRLHSM
jgi:DNA-binding PucR family transcriptional regulator